MRGQGLLACWACPEASFAHSTALQHHKQELESQSDIDQNACCACPESNFAWSTALEYQKQRNWQPIRHSWKLRHHKTSTTLCDSSWMSYMWMTAWLVYNKFKFLQIQCQKKNSLQRIDQVLQIPTAWARSLKLKQRDWKQGDWTNSDPSMAIAHDVWLLHKSESVNGRRLGKNIIAHRHENLSWRKAFLEALVGPVPKQTSRIPRRWSITNKELESESDRAQNACCACTESNYAWSTTFGHQKQGNWKPIRHSPKLRHHKASTTLCDSSWISYMWMTAGLVYNKFKFLQIQCPKKNSLQRIDQVLQIPTAWARSLKLKQRDWKQSDWSNSDPSMAIAHDVRLLHKSESVNGRRLGKNIIAHRHENLSWRKAFLEALVEPVPKQTSRIPRRWSITNKELESESDRAQNACCACTESNYAWPTTLGHQKQGNWKPIRHSPKLRHHKTSTTLCDSSWMSYMWMTAWLVYNKFKFLQIQCPKKNSLQRIDQVLHIPTAWARSLKLKQRDWKQGDWSNSDPSMAIAHDVWLLHKSESVNGRRLGENSIAHRHENLSWG